MVAYLDSSVLLRHILLGAGSIRHALDYPRVVSSELIEIECQRVLHRYRLAGELTDEVLASARERLDSILSGVDLLEMTKPVKLRAMGSFPVSVRTLDALHVSTALFVAESDEGVALFSHDRSMNLCARSLGLTAALI